eukprot:scaffold17054_cov83-Skeletonema_dohrnii-CCMP3373.AAC.2
MGELRCFGCMVLQLSACGRKNTGIAEIIERHEEDPLLNQDRQEQELQAPFIATYHAKGYLKLRDLRISEA